MESVEYDFKIESYNQMVSEWRKRQSEIVLLLSDMHAFMTTNWLQQDWKRIRKVEKKRLTSELVQQPTEKVCSLLRLLYTPNQVMQQSQEQLIRENHRLTSELERSIQENELLKRELMEANALLKLQIDDSVVTADSILQVLVLRSVNY